MPGAKGEGRPSTRTFMKIGKVAITRPDSLNWAVETAEKTTYHVSLPNAVRRAVEAAAESRAHDAQDWLREYRIITGNLEKTLEKALKSWERS